LKSQATALELRHVKPGGSSAIRDDRDQQVSFSSVDGFGPGAVAT